MGATVIKESKGREGEMNEKKKKKIARDEEGC